MQVPQRPTVAANTVVDSAFLSNLISPPLLFFFLGLAAVWARSDLEIPAPIARFLSLYLLFAIGFKGGVALSGSEFSWDAIKSLVAAICLASVMPVYIFYVMRSRLSLADSAALAATYGSISAVTFVTAISYLDANSIAWSGHLVAAMALMESPAIIVAILLYQLHLRDVSDEPNAKIPWRELMREACLNGSVFLVMGSLLIGWASGEAGMQKVSPVVVDMFTGLLCLFLLDMGIVAARRLGDLRSGAGSASFGLLVVAGLTVPLTGAVLACLASITLSLSLGDALLLTVLAASGSYIAVPAAMRMTLPEASPSVYLPMALAITFPFNIVLGIPLYHWTIEQIL